MEVKILSRELIKPFSLEIHHQEPYRLSLLDQLTPTTYSPMILFYANLNDTNSYINLLKRSLSQTLDIYYPVSGRVVDNLVIDHFHEGVPFLEAQINCNMSDFLKHQDLESLNLFLPYRPFTKEDLSVPILACQATVFSCGGIVFGLSLSHKLLDAGTVKAFATTWTSFSRGDLKGIVPSALTEPSRFFPPRKSFPENHLALMENMWFTEGNYITRKFVFDANAIARLKTMALRNIKPEASGKKISRIIVLSCFIWKCFMSATKTLSGSSPPSILVEAVNLRKKTNPPMSDGTIGDNFWWATSLADPNDENTQLHDLVNLLSEAIALYDSSDYTQSLQGEECVEAISEFCDQLEALFSMEKPDLFAFTSWCDVGITKLDFGCGAPSWVGVLGRAGPAFRNLTVFVETLDGQGVEAWITLDYQRMTILEHDPCFLAFCSQNPKLISSL